MNIVEKVGQSSISRIAFIGLSFTFLLRIFYSLFSKNFPFREFVQQIIFIGSRSLLVVLVASFFTGMVVALQFYDTLVRFGSVDLLGSAVALSLIRELGPVMTALMIIARVSSATTAEIGIMRNEQQLDALKCMAIDSYQYVLLPRVLAALVSVPILTAIFDMVGIAGGYFVGVVIQGESPGAYVQGIFDTVNAKDVLMGQVKSLVFALIVIWIPLVFGYYLHLDRKNSGAKGVSNATTNAVVISAILMLVFDYIVSSLML
ncbi:MlaE family ABC transporter permease [Thalassotalea euphylliae]|uniref:MlaE family ABC transporter permease n=1 Tax=Thalassotalea euphylliae TaxID=1655234 RepID=UPI00363689C5